MTQQLALEFREQIIRKKIGSTEYRRLLLLGPSRNTRHYFVFVHDALCENYPEEKQKHRYFDTKEDRDEYLNELKGINGIDEHGNDLGGNIPVGIYEKGFFIFGIASYPAIEKLNFQKYKNKLDKKA